MVIKREKLDFFTQKRKKINESIVCDSVCLLWGWRGERAQRSLKLQQAPAVWAQLENSWKSARAVPGLAFGEDGVWSWARRCPGAVLLLFLGGSLVLLGSSRGRETSPGVGGRSLLHHTHTHTHTRTGIVMPGYKLLMYFCCGTLIKLLFQLVHCGAVNGARPSSPPPSFRCKSALCSFLIIALHPALGFQRHPGNHVCSGCNLDCTLFVITIATRYNFAVLFKFYEFQCVSHVPVESGACSCRAGKAWAGLSG